MKLLVVASSIYDKGLFAKRRGITGLEIMLRDILDGVAGQIDCCMYATSLKNQGAQLGNIRLLPNNFTSFYRALNRVGIGRFKQLFNESNGRPLRERIKLTKATILLEQYVNEITPDIVNFHDLNDWNTFFVKRLENKGVKILLTDHLYIGIKNRTCGYVKLRNNEEKIFKNAPANLYVSFVSTGMRERFLKDYPAFPLAKIFCVVNGTNVKMKDVSTLGKPAVFEKLKGKKVLLCIGGFNARKNQHAIIDAVGKMNHKEKNEVCVLFIGAGNKFKISRILKTSKAPNSLFFIGTVPPSEMSSYYYYCDGTITTSLNESFGLTIIEGFCYGKPAILFNDIDSFKDLYDEKVCVPITEHSDKGIIKAINELTSKDWDYTYIRSYVNKFTTERVYKEYLEVYRKVNANAK